MDSIIRGTTPTINVTIPGLNEIGPNEIWFSFKSGTEVFTYTRSKTDSGITVAGETISKHLAQQETLAFAPGILYMQVRLLDELEMAYATPWLSFTVEEIIQDGVISPTTISGTEVTIDVEATVTAMYDEFVDMRNDMSSLAMSVAKKATGTNVSTPDAVSFDAPSLIVTFGPTQSGSGTPSASNIRPLVGKNSCSITVNNGDQPTAETNVSVASVTNYYLASNMNTGISRNSYGWSSSIASIDPTKLYLWGYSRSYDANGNTISVSSPAVLASALTDVVSIEERYLASPNRSGISHSTSGWTTTVQATSASKNYLWNYKMITYADDSQISSSPRIISAYNGEIPGENSRLITATFGQTIYGGIVDFVKGEVTVTHGYYSPYAGESLNGVWISDRDVYSPGRIPSAGAQVAYELDTPWTIQIVKNNIEVTPNTTISTSDGTITLYYPSNIRSELEQFEIDISELEIDVTLQEKYQKLITDYIPNTIQTYEFNDGTISKIYHKSGNTAIRTDTYSFTSSSITEVRTLNTGERLTITTNLTTLATTITYSA